MLRRCRAALALAGLLGYVAAAWATGNYPGNAVRINGEQISYQRYMGFYLEHQRENGVAIGARGDQLGLLTRLRKEAMEMLIDQELLKRAAAARNIDVAQDEVDAAWAEVSAPYKKPGEFARRLAQEGYTEDEYREHLRRMLAAGRYLDGIRAAVAEVSDEELESYYRDNESRLTLPEQVAVRHILLSWKPLGKPDDRAALHEQMQGILEQARAGEDFAELARKYSDDATAKDGGYVGFFHRGEMVPAFEEAAFALEPGEISGVVETVYGVHILKLEDRKAARLLPLDEIREKLRDHIRDEKMAAAVEAEKSRLRQEAEIQILIPIERPAKK
jgi:parvulin-like peptidyl-prolyl isomerase